MRTSAQVEARHRWISSELSISHPDKAVWPYMQQWHLDVQREVAKNMVATVSYVGSKGTHLNRQYDLNQIYPSADCVRIPIRWARPSAQIAHCCRTVTPG